MQYHTVVQFEQSSEEAEFTLSLSSLKPAANSTTDSREDFSVTLSVISECFKNLPILTWNGIYLSTRTVCEGGKNISYHKFIII